MGEADPIIWTITVALAPIAGLAALALLRPAPAPAPATVPVPESYGEAMRATPDTFWTLDRFEDGDWAILEGDAEATVHVPRAWLPRAAREGHVLRLEIGSEDELDEDSHASELRFVVDEVETQQRRDEMQDLRDALPDGPEGDLGL